MNYSKQRACILQVVLNNQIHPTADDVYSLIKQELPNISLGTVYRNLSLLSQNGEISKISLPNASDRFDGRIEPHYHMICEVCGEVKDIELHLLDELDEHILHSTGFQISHHDLIIHGTCNNCNN